jgi:hypothetical protein
MSSETSRLPRPKKEVKFTPAALRLIQALAKAFASNNFLLLYFSNRKIFTLQFTEPAFRDALRNKFQFLQLSRADKAGNWLTTCFRVDSTPYFAIIDPSSGEFVAVHYGDMTTPEIKTWLQEWLLKSPKFALARSIFPDLIDEVAEYKKKSSYSYGTKLRVTFSSQAFEDKTIYVNKVAPLRLAFEKYCNEKKIDPTAYYFLFRGVELPGTMTASQFGLRNGSVVHVHPNEDKTSTEPLSITVVGVDGASAIFNVTKGKRVGVFLKSYCDLLGLTSSTLRFVFNNDPVSDDLTFAEHDMKPGDQIFTQVKPIPRSDFMFHMMPPGPDMNPMGLPQPEPFDLPMAAAPNFTYMYSQGGQRPPPPPPQAFGIPYPGVPYSITQPKQVGYPKTHDNNPQSIWEGFDMNIN